MIVATINCNHRIRGASIKTQITRTLRHPCDLRQWGRHGHRAAGTQHRIDRLRKDNKIVEDNIQM